MTAHGPPPERTTPDPAQRDPDVSFPPNLTNSAARAPRYRFPPSQAAGLSASLAAGPAGVPAHTGYLQGAKDRTPQRYRAGDRSPERERDTGVAAHRSEKACCDSSSFIAPDLIRAGRAPPARDCPSGFLSRLRIPCRLSICNGPKCPVSGLTTQPLKVGLDHKGVDNFAIKTPHSTNSF